MAQQKRWEPPPFVLKKSQKQIDEEAKEKEIDKTPGRWTPPDFAGIPESFQVKQEPIKQSEAIIEPTEPSQSALERIYEAGSKGLLDYLPESVQKYRPKELYKNITEEIRAYGENQKGKNIFDKELRNNVRYAQAFGETLSSGLEEALNPINLGLMALSGGSSAAFKGAKGAKDVQNAQKLYQIGKALEVPGKAASVGMVAHGGHKVLTGETTEEQVGGGIEALLGAAGFRFRGKREYPKSEPRNITPDRIKTKVNTKEQHGPFPQKYFPLRGNENPIKSGKFTSGEKGTYKEGELIHNDIGGDVPIETAYNHGTIKTTKSGIPFVQAGSGVEPIKSEVNTIKLEQIRQYMNAVQNKEIPEGTKFEDYVNSLRSVEEPIVTTPDKPLTFDEILPPTESLVPDVRQPSKGLAQYRGYQEGFEEIPGFNLYDVPTESGKMTTLSEQVALEQGYELPPISEAMGRPESLPTIEGESTELTQPKPKPKVKAVTDINGNTRVWIDDIEFTDRFGPGGPTDFDVRRLQSQINDPESFKRLAELKGEQYVGMADPLPVNQPNQLVPDIRQLPNPVESIGDEIINPTDDLSTGIELNESNQPIHASDQWQEILDELDARQAPDSEYRDILSTGSKEPLKKRETWRSRVQKYIRMDRDRDNPVSEMGAPSREIAYHGTDDVFSVFDPNKIGTRTDPGFFGKGVYLVSDKANASRWGKHIIQGEVNLENPFEVTGMSDWINKTGQQKTEGKTAYKKEIERITNNLKLKGHDGVIITRSDGVKQYVVFDSSKINIQNHSGNDLNTTSEMRIPGTNNIAVGGADPEVLDMLATALYAKQDNPATVAKEGLQNSADEMKISGKPGPIKIAYDWYSSHPITGKHTRSVIVQDKGRGMTDEELYTIYTDVGKSGKRNIAEASGGFGFAKAAPLLSGDYVQVESITKLPNGKIMKYTFEGNPQQMKDQKVGVPVVSQEMPPGTETGFKVETFFPDKKYLSNAESIVKAIVSNSPGMDNVQIYSKQNSALDAQRKLDDFLSNPNSQYADKLQGAVTAPLQTTLNTPNADIDIHYDTDNIERTEGKVAFLNNGMFVKENSQGYSYRQSLPGLPAKITANIKPTVAEGTEGYPFGLNREEINHDILSKVQTFIEDKFIKPAQQQKKDEIQNVYDSLQPSPGNNYVVLDSGNRYTLAELNHINNSPSMNAIAGTMGKIISDLTVLMDSQTTYITEKFGFRIADADRGGVNISSNGPPSSVNGKTKTTILINQFSAIEHAANPKEAAARIVHIVIHEFTHNIAREEGAGYTWALSQVYTKYDLQEQLNARRRIIYGITGKDGNYTPELQNLLREYTDSRGRTATQEDVLSRESESSNPKSSGTSEISRSDKPDGDGITSKPVEGTVEGHPREAIEASVGRLKEALIAGKLGRDNQDLVGSAERSKRAGQIAGVKTHGMAGYQQQLGMLRGPLPKAEVDSPLLDEDMDVLIDAISDNGELRPYQEISAKRGLLKLLVGEAPQNSEMALLSQVFDDPFLGEIVELHAGLGGISGNRRLINNVLHLAKTMKASMDLSGSLRQGLPFIDRKEYWKAFWNMHKYLGSEVAYQGGLEAMRSHPDFDLIMETPLFLAGFKGQGMGQNSENVLANREEQFISEWGDRIPLVKQSQRAYVGFLDELRFNTMLSFMDSARKLGIPLSQEITKFEDTKREMVQTISTPELNEIAKMVNIFTGRGDLGRFEKMAVEANWVLWSPKFLKSRMTILNPFYYKNASPFVRKQAIHSLLVIAGAGASMLALAKMNGAEVNYDDPTSADFMKARFGKTRMDPWSGLQQNVVAEARILTYLRNAVLFIQGKPIPKNQKYRPGSGYNARTARDVAIDFAENKESPLFNFVSSLADLGKSYEPSGLSKLATDDWNLVSNNRVTKEVINLYSPMMIDTIIDLIKDDPTLFPLGMDTLMGKTLPLAAASMYGSSIQTYDQRIPGGQYRPRVPRLLP